METSTKNNILTDFTEDRLLELIDKYPWFGCAHRALATKNSNKVKLSYLLNLLFEHKQTMDDVPLNSEEFILPNKTAANFNETEQTECIDDNHNTTEPSKSDNSPLKFDLSKTDDIIDNFINSAAEHKITTQNDTIDFDIKDYGENQNFDENMISEELAEIYRKQGLYRQAIDIYRKLILLNPKKSVYFAEIIENIEKNINN